MKGCYLLFISNTQNFEKRIGRKRTYEFHVGYYIYVGSAMGKGSTSLKHRILRHLNTSRGLKKDYSHWHIDYFLDFISTSIETIVILPNSLIKEECDLSRLISELSDYYFDGFGCSDCSCRSHLYFFTPENSFIHKILGSFYQKVSFGKK